jgi:serine acetyltransferase
MIPHAYGITLSADELGADIQLGQNVTIGTNGRDMAEGDNTTNHKPRIGNLVRFHAGCIISGRIRIGNNVIVAANAIVDKDVPDNSIVYGVNKIKPLQDYHMQYLKNQLWHCKNIYRLIPGLVYINRKMYIDKNYAEWRNGVFRS